MEEDPIDKIFSLISDENFTMQQVQKAIENSELDEDDKIAMYGVAAVRRHCKSKSQEPQILWRFIRLFTEVKMPMQLLDFTYYLYPHNEQYFGRILTPTAYKIITEQANYMISAKMYENEEHLEHLRKIANGELMYGYSLEMPSVKNKE